jgi:hypothetical protein
MPAARRKVSRNVRRGMRRERSAEGEVVAAADQVCREEGREAGVRRGPQYVHVEVCLMLKDGGSEEEGGGGR